MIRFPEVRALARTIAAVVLSVAALGASPAAAATITISDTAFSGNQTVCPRANDALATPIPVNAFQVTADALSSLSRIQVRLLPAGGFANLERVEIRSADLATLYGSIIPSADSFWISLVTPLPASTTAASFRIAIVPRRYADMPPAAAGVAYGIQAQLVAASATGHTVVGNDLVSATVTVNNAPPANVTWSGVTSGAAIAMNWSTAANVVVMRREAAPIFDAAGAGTVYVANTTVGGSQVLFVGNAASYSDASVQPNRTYYYKVFTRSPSCVTYSTGAALGPIVAGGSTEGDATEPSIKPVVGIVSPGPGPVTRPFKVKIRVFSPNSLPITEVRLYGTTNGSETLLGSSIGAGALITRNANYDGGSPADPASGFYEFTAPAGFADGNTSLRAWARNVVSTALPDGVYSSPVGVSAGAALGDGKLLVRDNSSQLCADCHLEKTHSAETVGADHGSWYVGCRGCHDPHGTTNAKLIAKEITPPAYAGLQTPQQIYYTGATGNVNGAKVNPDGTGLCQACHNRTAYYRRGVTGQTHYITQACGDCHKHEKGLGAGCSSCHGTPGRNVAGGDSMQAAAPPRGAPPAYATTGNAVGMHLAHVTGTTFRAALTCSNCHVIPNAHNGTVDAPTFPAMGSIPQAGTWSAAASTCTSTYCHAGPAARNFAGTNMTPNWLTSPGLTCQSCHASPPTTDTVYTHAVTDTNCELCHGPGYALGGITGDARLTHINGVPDAVAGGCTGCHGGTNPGGNAAPPARATPATSSTLANAVGAHQGHVTKSNFMPAPLACTECHAVYQTTGHRDGTGSVVFNPTFDSAGAATYVGHTNPTTPTCNAVYCHAGSVGGTAAGMTPNWATGGAMNCASCHGNPPNHPHPSNTTCASCHPSAGGETYSNTGPTTGTVARTTHIDTNVNRSTSACTSCHGTLTATGVTLAANTVQSAPGYDTTGSVDTFGGSTSASPGVGAHRTHLTATRIRTGGAAVCNDCHVLPPADNDTAHAQDAGTGGARAAVRFLSFGGLTGTYSGSTSGTSNGTTAGSCSNTYCHGGKYGTPPPSWSGGSMTCGSCHGFPPTSHTFVSTTMECGSCHPGGWTTCTTANQAACGVPSNHLNGVFEPTTTTCTSCHGGTNPAPPVAAIKSPVGPNAIGAHQAHVTERNIRTAMVCDECHPSVTAVDSPGHNTGTVNTAFTTVRSTGTVWNPGAPQPNCTTSWCHGGAASQSTWGGLGAPQWNAATGTYNTCAACHAARPPLNAGTHHPPNDTTACSVCHGTGYAAGVVSGTALGTHVDGTITYRAGCTGCHGDTTVTGALATNNAAAPGFNANAIDISGAPTGARVGAHAAHLSGTRLRTTLLACSECHPVPGDLTHADGAGNSTGARANVSMPGTLANGTVLGGANTNPSYSSPNCSNVYCHGARYALRTGYSGTNSGSPQWTQSTAVAANCGTCHAAAPTAGTTHTNANNGTEACSLCHTTYLNCTKADNFATCQLPVEHINGQFDPVQGGCGMCHGNPPATVSLTAPFVGAKHPENPICGSCHGSGYNTTDYASLPGSHGGTTVPGSDAPNNGCTACHGVLAGPTAAGVTVNTTASIAPGYFNGASFGVDTLGSITTSNRGVGAHDAHVRKTNLRSAALACTECHTRSLPASGDVAHSNGVIPTLEFGGLGTTGGITTATFNGTGCAATYCHGNFTNGNDNLTPPAPTLPAQITGVVFSNVTSSSITIGWTAQAAAAVYFVERSPTQTGTYVRVGTSTGNSYVDSGLAGSGTYWYRISGWSTVGTGTASTALSQVTAASGGGAVATRFDMFGEAAGVTVDGGTTNVLTATTALVPTTGTTFTNRNITTANATLNATVRRESAAAALTSGTTYNFVDLYTPALTAANNTVAAGVTVRIENYMRTTGTATAALWTVNLYENVGTTNTARGSCTATYNATITTAQASTCTISNVAFTAAVGSRLKVRIQVVAAAGYGRNTLLWGATMGTTSGSTSFTATLGSPSAPPALPTGAPTGFAVAGTPTSSTVSLSWDPMAIASSYKVERSANGTSGWTQVGQPGTNSFTDRALTADTTYYYRVKASNVTGDSVTYTGTLAPRTAVAQAAGPISWTGTFNTGSTSLTCSSCHGNPPLGTHPTNANACSGCHPGYGNNTDNPQIVDLTVHMNGVVNVDCVGCHSSTQNHRDPVAGEFSLLWSHKKSAASQTVTKWDCIVCHMEGNPANGERSAVHGDGNINLRDPDTGNNIKQVVFTGARGNPGAVGSYGAVGGDPDMVFTTFRRNLALPLDTDPDAARVQAIMVNQCLKCHDANGALAFGTGLPLNVMAGVGGVTRTAGKPFGTTIVGAGYNGGSTDGGSTNTACATGTNGCVANVKDSFTAGTGTTGNSSYHPILGRNNNYFARGSRMAAPWNLARIAGTSNVNEFGYLMSCWDCHALPTDTGTITRTVTAHGGTATLRGTAFVSGTPSATNRVDLCTKCHALYDTCGGGTCGSINSHGGTGATASAWSSTNSRTTKTVYVQYGCNICHSSGFRTATMPVRPVRAKDAHGVNALPAYTTGAVLKSGRWASATANDKRPYSFIRAVDTLGDHQPATAVGATITNAGNCDMLGTAAGGPNCDNGPNNYTAGGVY